MDEPCDLAATRMLAAFAAGALSPVEVMRSVFERLDAAEPVLAATWAVDREGAMTAAHASEARWRSGAPTGPLDGVPASIKEMIATRGVPCPVGTAAAELTPAATDAPPAARLREAGAILWGKTTNPDLGMLSSGLSSFHALARNPWDPTRTPGGSSAGAAAAAAAGYGPLHLGTDIGGSVRLPAGWCGIVALKPSGGRVPIDPPFHGRVAGPMTRTVDDAALMMGVLARPDARDWASLPPADIDWGATLHALSGLRIGVQLEAGAGLPCAPEIAIAVQGVAQLLERAGARVEEVAPFFTREMLDGLDRFWRMRAWEQMRDVPEERRERLLAYIREWMAPAEHFSARDVFTGFDQMLRIRETGARAFAGFDFWLSPTAPVPAFAADWASPLNDPARPFEHIAYTVPWNMTEQPALSINAGFTAGGLPIGVQVIGRRFDDAGVLALGRTLEKLLPRTRAWPRPWEN